MDSSILITLFSTLAAIVATLTGLIGSFATFKLQKLEAKLDFLKDYTLHKEIQESKTLNNKIREYKYPSIRIIYVHNMAAIDELKQCIDELDYHQHTEEYTHDLENITHFQKQYDTIRKVSIAVFTHSLFIAFMNLVGLVFTNNLVASHTSLVFLLIDGVALAYIFIAFARQLKLLME